jgi:hypothetical protein
MADPCRPSSRPPAKTNPVVPTTRKEVEVFVLVAAAGVGRRLARLLTKPSPRARRRLGDEAAVAHSGHGCR